MEVVGVVSSSFALLEVVGKAASGALKLKKLWDEVHDIPDMIFDHMRELDIINSILKSTASKFENDDTPPEILNYCQSAVDDLDNMICELSAGIDSPKRRVRIRKRLKVVIEKDTLEKCQERLRRAVNMLSLAQQGCTMTMMADLRALVKNQPVTIVEGIMVAMTSNQFPCPPSDQKSLHQGETQGQAERQSSIAFRTSAETSSTTKLFSRRANGLSGLPWTYAAMGLLAWRQTERQPPGNASPGAEGGFSYDVRIQLPYWLTRRAWDLHVSRSMQGWTYMLKPWRTRPIDDPVFDAAGRGDTDVIETLIRTNQASLWDRDKNGWTLLHHAAYGGPETIDRLVTWGHDINEPDNDNYLPLHNLIIYRHSRLGEKELHEFLLRYNAYDEDGSFLLSMHTYTNIYRTLFRCLSRNSKLFSTLEPFLSPNHYRLSIVHRLACVSFTNEDTDPNSIRLFLRRDGVLHKDDVSALQRDGICLLNIIAFACGHSCFGWNGKTTDRFAEFQKLVRQVVPMTANLSVACRPRDERVKIYYNMHSFLIKAPLTALFHVVYGYMVRLGWFHGNTIRSNSAMNRALRRWLDDLNDCGVDLQSYGRAEEHLFQVHNLRTKTWIFIRSPYRYVKLNGFRYGPTPGDWEFFWDSEVERYAGKFWTLVETPRFPMPGSWVDDE